MYIKLYGEAWTGFEDTRELNQLIVVGEQGYGDSIQFVRFIGELHKKGIKTTFYGPEFLRNLFKTQTKFGHMTTMLKREKKSTLWCPLMTLPHILGADERSIPDSKGT